MGAILLTGSAFAQVNLPEGFEVIEFGAHEHPSRPRMNNCGEIVFAQGLFQELRIYLYDNGRIRAITGPDGEWVNVLPDINDRGTIAWVRAIFNEYDTPQVIVLENGERTTLGPGGPPAINIHGEVATQLFRGTRCRGSLNYDTVLYTGGRILRLNRDRLWDQGQRINDHGDVVWMHTDFCVNPWAGDIRIYSQGRVIVLPSEYTQVQGPDINYRGDGVWDAGPVIELYRGGETIPLVENGAVPAIGNQGNVYVAVWGFNRSTWAPWLYRASRDPPMWHRLTDDTTSSSRGDVNDWGEVVWLWFLNNQGAPGGYRLLRRIRNSDAQFDGAVDLSDYADFSRCMTGPVPTARLCDCQFLDIDHDGDVDLADFARFQDSFTGSRP